MGKKFKFLFTFENIIILVLGIAIGYLLANTIFKLKCDFYHTLFKILFLNLIGNKFHKPICFFDKAAGITPAAFL